MSRPALRFRPPAVAPPAEFAWLLARAFAPAPASALAPANSRAAFDLAEALGLSARLAARHRPTDLAAELDPAVSARLREARALALARELRFDETLSRVADAARDVGCEIALLKGRALVLAGESLPGSRPSSDLDLLAPTGALPRLDAELRRRGFVADRGVRHEHHLAALRHPSCAPVELHRYLPGVRLDDDRSASWEALERAGELAPPPSPDAWPGVRLPSAAARRAHAVAHALAQHGHTARLAGWSLVGDLIDLRSSGDDDGWRAWIARDVTADEIDAALALARICAAGRDPFALDAPAQATLLASHFLASALDADYAEALKLRALESPLHEGSRVAAKWRLALRAFVPPGESAPGARTRRVGRWLGRPFVLAAKAFRAAGAARRLAAGTSRAPGDAGPTARPDPRPDAAGALAGRGSEP